MLIFYPFNLSVSNTGRNTCRAGKYGVYFSGKAGEPLLENRFGFIREKIDIKILILYILSRCRFPADSDQLSDMVLCDDGISYFDYAECLDELIESGHVELTDGKYVITEKGRSNGVVTESSVPFSVRKKATQQTNQFNSAEARRSKIVTEVTPNGSGFDLHLSLSDGVVQIMDMRLYADDQKQADMLISGFRRKAESAYNAFIQSLLQ